jgi:hypothetical protein
LHEAYPKVACASEDPVELLTAIHESTGEKFMFVVDDWDFIFKSVYSSEPQLASHDDKMDYLKFLHALLKGKYVLMVYMTGVFPLPPPHCDFDFNSFTEYSLAQTRFNKLFGFTQVETKSLLARYAKQFKKREHKNITLESLGHWYRTSDGVYNSYATIMALKAKRLDFYWYDAAPKDELLNIINRTPDGFARKLASLLCRPCTKEDDGYFVQLPFDDSDNGCNVLSLLTVLGYLRFHNSYYLSIPNIEISHKLKELVGSKKEYSYIYELSNAFPKLQDAIFSLDKQGISSLFEEKLHGKKQIFATCFDSDRETMIRLAFLSAIDYEIKTDDKLVEIAFTPKDRKNAIFFAFLDDDVNPSDAIRELKAKNENPLCFYLNPSSKIYGFANAYIVAISCDGSDGAVSCDIEAV